MINFLLGVLVGSLLWPILLGCLTMFVERVKHRRIEKMYQTLEQSIRAFVAETDAQIGADTRANRQAIADQSHPKMDYSKRN